MRLVAEMWTLLVMHISSLFWYELTCQIGINKQPMKQTLKKLKESVVTTAVTNAQLLPHTDRVSQHQAAVCVSRTVPHVPAPPSQCNKYMLWLVLLPFPTSVSSTTQRQQPSCCCQSLSCVWLCNPMDCSMPGFSVLHHLLELAPTRVHWVRYAIQPSHPVVPFSSCIQSFQPQGLF